MLKSIQYLALLVTTLAIPLERRSINGPVISSNFPDPSFFEDNGVFYAFGTQGSNGIPLATSNDFNTWTVSGQSALPGAGSWSNGQNIWAPDVKKIGNQYVMYYCALPNNGGKHCIGAAVSSTPAGPYNPVGGSLICDEAGGGVIDPFGFVDSDGQVYLVYKVDGNSIGSGGECGNRNQPIQSTPIMAQKMSSDGLSTDGSAPVQILDRDSGDGPLVEAPAILRAQNGDSATYFLFFSSGCYSESDYDSSYAVSRNGVLGPYTKATSATAPILRTGYPSSGLYAPGGLSTGQNGDNRVVFHADQGTTADVRQMYVGYLNIDAAAGTVSL